MADLMVSMTKVPAVAHHVATHPIAQHITSGVNYMSYFLIGSLMAASAICGGLGYYIAHRGISGVANDLTNIKNDIAMLKTKVGLSA